MTAEQLEPDEVSRAQLVMVRRFLGQQCVLDRQLVSPMRTVWQAYQQWAKAAGIIPSAVALRATLDSVPWARVEERTARGRIRTVVHGIGVRS